MSKLRNVIANGEKDFAEGRGTALKLAEVSMVTESEYIEACQNDPEWIAYKSCVNAYLDMPGEIRDSNEGNELLKKINLLSKAFDKRQSTPNDNLVGK